MADLNITLSRRQALAGLSIIGAAAIPVATASAEGFMGGPSRAEWDTTLAKFRHHHDEHEAACVAHYAVEDRYYAEKPDQPLGGEFMRGDTVESYHARPRRDRAEFERADAECRHRTGFDLSKARQSEACDASWNALGDLLGTPAPGPAEVVQKIELATEYGRKMDDLEQACADLRRFLSQGRA